MADRDVKELPNDEDMPYFVCFNCEDVKIYGEKVCKGCNNAKNVGKVPKDE